MKRLILTITILLLGFYIAFAQQGINFNKTFAAGGKLLMSIDSSAKKVYYANIFPNQARTSFNYLPEVSNVSITINFRKNINLSDYVYSILIDDKPFFVNKPIKQTDLKETNAGGDEELFLTATLPTLSIKGKVITVLTQDLKAPQKMEKAIFYGKTIPKAKILSFSTRYKNDKGVDYKWLKEPNVKTDIKLDENLDEITIVKDRSDIDYVYTISIIEKLTKNKIFEANTWTYGGLIEANEHLPYVKFNPTIFKKSGAYEIIIEPAIDWKSCKDCNVSTEEIEKLVTRYTLNVTIPETKTDKKDQLLYGLIGSLIICLIILPIFFFYKRKNKKDLAEKEEQKNLAKLQLSAVRSQLNPHFLFNALAGIQNLMNKNEIENANKYLAKFARITRNVLNNKDLVSLSHEKNLLDDYLQMEQLRFGFQYHITHDEGLALDNIEIPSMLLQPFVENAVKHGVSNKNNQGKIDINFNKEGNNLILTVLDNGNGFDVNKNYEGLGLNLSKNRIALLNNIYKESAVLLEIKSAQSGTKIIITLKDWL